MQKTGIIRTSTMRLAVGMALVGLLTAASSEAPAPRRMPRAPVNREELNDRVVLPPSREIEGPATIIDGERLRVGNFDLRLFGVVPPQLSASYGPQAREALDQATAGQNVRCLIRDRDHDGRYLATCHTANSNLDLALELLKRGLAVTARGSLQPTDLAAPYEAAEQAATGQKLGLWSSAPPPPVKVELSPVAPVATVTVPLPPAPPEIKESKKEEKPAAALPVTHAAAEQPVVAMPAVVAVPGFFARYQLLLTALVMLATALGILAAIGIQRARDRREEMRATAAALRGELLAARAVCQARLKIWTDADEKSAAWPRIRSMLYQAYVGRLGLLGATLARQIASIYGQASDYAAYYGTSGEGHGDTTGGKKRALQTLMQHISEVLPKLAHIEETGRRLKDVPASAPSASMPPAAVQASAPVTPVMPAMPQAAAPVTEEIPLPPQPSPLWGLMKKLARPRTLPEMPADDTPEEDYAALMEEEIADLSYKPEDIPGIGKTGTGL